MLTIVKIYPFTKSGRQNVGVMLVNERKQRRWKRLLPIILVLPIGLLLNLIPKTTSRDRSLYVWVYLAFMAQYRPGR